MLAAPLRREGGAGAAAWKGDGRPLPVRDRGPGPGDRRQGSHHATPRPPGADLRGRAGPGDGSQSRGARGAQGGRALARHRQAGGPRVHSLQTRQADPRRVREDEDSPAHRRRDTRHGPLSLPAHARGALPPREIRRQRLSRSPQGGRDSPGGADPLGGRLFRRADVRSPVPQASLEGGGAALYPGGGRGVLRSPGRAGAHGQSRSHGGAGLPGEPHARDLVGPGQEEGPARERQAEPGYQRPGCHHHGKHLLGPPRALRPVRDRPGDRQEPEPRGGAVVPGRQDRPAPPLSLPRSLPS